MKIVLWLPWPDPRLSPNRRLCWQRRSKLARQAREAGQIAARHQVGGDFAGFPPGKLSLWLTFYPPDKRKRDDDNLIASFKPYRDGIADALGINDARFVAMPFVHTQTRKGGAVRVCITDMPEGFGQWE